MASFEQLILQASNTATARAADHLLLTLLYVLTLTELRNLRLISSTFEQWITTGLPGIFDTLFVDAWYARIKDQSRFGLQFIGALCKELVINIPTSSAPGTLFPGIIFNHPAIMSNSSTLKMPLINDWPMVFSMIPKANTITLCVPLRRFQHRYAPNSNIGFIRSIREGFEHKARPLINTLRLQRFEAALLPFLRWSGPAYGRPHWLSGGTWANITQLELQLLLPTGLDNEYDRWDIQLDSIKTMHSWFKSFVDNLRELRFNWIGGNGAGPHPLALDLVLPARHSSQVFLTFRMLGELWVANCAKEELVRPLLMYRAPRLAKYMYYTTATRPWQLLSFDGKTEPWREADVEEMMNSLFAGPPSNEGGDEDEEGRIREVGDDEVFDFEL